MHREKHSSARGWRGQRMAWAGLETLCVALQAASARFPLPGSPWDSSITALQTGREARLACEPLNQEALRVVARSVRPPPLTTPSLATTTSLGGEPPDSSFGVSPVSPWSRESLAWRRRPWSQTPWVSHPFPPRLSTCVALTKLLYLFALRFLFCEMGTPLVISTSRAIESLHTRKAFGVTPVLQGSRCQLSLYRRRGMESFLPQQEPEGFLQTPPLLSQLPSQGRFVDLPPSKTGVTSRIQPLG